MSRDRMVTVISLFLLAACASTMTPRANTRDELVSYVNRAAAVVARSGPSCATFKQPAWMSGDYYIFVSGPDGTTVCHPNTSLIGKATSEIVDANGMNVGDAILKAAMSPEGHGWVNYVWPRPGTPNPVPKSTYVTKVTGPDGKTYIVGSGGYNL